MATVTSYQTVSGDMWDLISYKVFGTEYFSDMFCYINPSYANVWVFDAGITLRIPQVTPINNIQTPPWLAIGQLTQASTQ